MKQTIESWKKEVIKQYAPIRNVARPLLVQYKKLDNEIRETYNKYIEALETAIPLDYGTEEHSLQRDLIKKYRDLNESQKINLTNIQERIDKAVGDNRFDWIFCSLDELNERLYDEYQLVLKNIKSY